MAKDGNDIDPLVQYLIRQPENDDVDVTIQMPMTPSELKNRLIFGPESEHNDDDTVLSQEPSSSSSAPRRLRRSRSGPTMAVVNELVQPVPVEYKTEQYVSRYCSVRQVVLLIFVVYLSLNVLIYWLNQDSYLGNQTHPLVDALYFCVGTMCTIGYGDITPGSVVTKLFTIFSLFVGLCFISLLFTGIATYVDDIEEDYMMRNLRYGSFDDPAEKKWYTIDFTRVGRMSKVVKALGAVVLCLGFGVLIMHFIEGIGWLDSFYYSFMSVTTVGYGDEAFKTLPGRFLAAIWLLVSTLMFARALLYVAAARVAKGNRMQAKRALSENMSISQFLAADIDNDGSVSIPEFMIFKLKMMGKITQDDITPILHQFEKLDPTSSGKITLVDLLETSTNDLSTATSG